MSTKPRTEGLGASDAPVALGISPFRTPLELYLEKIGRGPPFEETLPVRVGKALEPVTIAAFVEETGLDVSRIGEQLIDPEHPWRWVTLDGMVEDGALLEAKAISWNRDEWGEPGTDQVPVPYAVQAQHGMAVTGAVLVYVPVLFDAKRFQIYKVERDQALIDVITAREREFWQRVLDRNPPPIESTDDARLRYEHSIETSVVADEITLANVAKLRAQAQALKQAEQQHDATKAAVMEFMAEAAVLTDPDGKSLATWRSSKGRQSLDIEGLRKAHPELAAQFTREGKPSRRFLLKS